MLLRGIADLSGPAPRSFGANVLGASAYDSEAMGYSAHWRASGTVGSGCVLAVLSADLQRWQGRPTASYIFLHRLPTCCAVSYL